ncbi:MAG: cytochrome c biogenesis protein ResB [Deltaproteobacteria bacterium]|nr:cytochrome c biogenesis protein ResB [Deltaproteobacteria bacterium]
MKQQKRPLWQPPWQYKESALLVCGVLVAGFALQLTLGHFNFFLLHYPANAIAAGGLALLLALCALARKNAVILWLSGIPFCVSLMAALLCFSLVMGLTPQAARVDPHAHNLFSDLGFSMVTASWPFVLLYALTLVSLGLVIMRRLAAFRKKDIGFYCNHLGLWILLLAAGLGATDMQRFVMYVREGEVEWRVYSRNNDVFELPIAVRLHDFSMEEYPPKLVIINRENGKPQPEDRPFYFQIDPKRPTGALGDWTVVLDEYIHEAVRGGDGYKASPMPASTPAARVTVTNTRTGATKTGWVCGGGTIPEFFSGLPLDGELTVVMTQPEPKRFVSDITVLTKEGMKKDARLEVNKPLSLGPWMLYQYGYDNQAGKMSAYSGIELVRDAWLWPAYAGIFLMIAGSVWLIWAGTGKRREDQ